MTTWQWSSFAELSPDDLYAILQARQAVFTVEQKCAYQDADGLDRVSWHLTGWTDEMATRQVVAYLRVVFPGEKFREPSLGRVLTTPAFRGQGAGKALMGEALLRVARAYPGSPTRISAQLYLQKFYALFGFERVSDPYDEDGIPHIEMLRKAPP